MPHTAAEIAKIVHGEIVGDGAVTLRSFAPADRAQPGDLTFAENENYFARADQSAAAAILLLHAVHADRRGVAPGEFPLHATRNPSDGKIVTEHRNTRPAGVTDYGFEIFNLR